jgi:shikimate kinase
MDNSLNRSSIEKDERPIFLVGFMGAGKTTVGKALARHLDYEFFDLDSIIENREGKSVRQIFSDHGETEFRAREREAIDSLRSLKKSVIALGGGAFISEQNRKTLAEIGVSVWLDCPLEICLKRVKGDSLRPLLGDDSEMRALLEKRRPAYALAHCVASVGHLSPEEAAAAIARLLGR